MRYVGRVTVAQCDDGDQIAGQDHSWDVFLDGKCVSNHRTRKQAREAKLALTAELEMAAAASAVRERDEIEVAEGVTAAPVEDGECQHCGAPTGRPENATCGAEACVEAVYGDVPKAGEIRPVTGGHGLMLVVEYDSENDAARMRGHGPAKGFHWFPASRLRAPVGRDVVLRERANARARKLDCNNPDCWCRHFKDDSRLSR